MTHWINSPALFAQWFLGIWLAAFAVGVAYRGLTGRLSLSGLITTDGSTFSPGRLQMLLLTVSGGLAYATDALSHGNLPSLPDSAVVVLAASHGVYLTGKTAGK